MKRLLVLLTPLLLLSLLTGAVGCGEDEGAATTPTATPAPASTATTTPSTTPAPTPTEALYENQEHGFTIGYPEGSWLEQPAEEGGAFQVSHAADFAVVQVWVECLTDPTSLAEWTSEAKRYLEYTPQYQLISERDVTVDGVPAHEIVYIAKEEPAEPLRKMQCLLFVREEQGFFIKATAAAEQISGGTMGFDHYQQAFDEILYSFRLLPSYTCVLPTPCPGGTYTSAEHGFSITCPAGWCQLTPIRAEYVLYVAPPEQSPSVHIAIEYASEGATLSQWVQDALQGFPEYWANFQLLSGRQVTLGDGTPAYEIVFTGISDLSPGLTLKCKYLFVLRGTQVFFVMGASMPDVFPQDEPVLDEVLYSFRLR